MKIKCLPQDFQVHEQTLCVATKLGHFSFYKLEKENWTTHDALNLLRRKWNINSASLSYGGLKDRHATTSQYFTIQRGPERCFAQMGIRVTYLGRLGHAFGPRDISGNRFDLVLRDLTESEIEPLRNNLEGIKNFGLINYFDDQRFGSVPRSGKFIAKEMILGNFEEALRLALTAPYEHDLAKDKKEKEILNKYWLRWVECKQNLERGHARSLVDYLVSHPDDFRGACLRLRPDLRSLYLFAYQSKIWNRLVATWMEDNIPKSELIYLQLKTDSLPSPITIPDSLRSDWNSLTFPYPSARLKMPEGAFYTAALEKVMSKEGFPLQEMKIRQMQKPFFAKGERALVSFPKDLTYEMGSDELHPQKWKASVSFQLPAGSYATMLIKRLQAVIYDRKKKQPSEKTENQTKSCSHQEQVNQEQDLEQILE